MSTPQARSAIKFDLFADAARKRKIETLGDPLQIITRHIDFAHLARVVDQLLPRGDTSKGGRPPYPTEVMVRILVLKHLYNLSDEQAEYQLLDRMSYQRFCLLTDSVNIPDRNTIWHYQQRAESERHGIAIDSEELARLRGLAAAPWFSEPAAPRPLA